MKKGNVLKLFTKCCVLVMMLLPFSVMHTQAQVKQEVGTASYYADKFHGRKTASGEVFDNSAFTAAHNKLPLGTYVKVTNTRNQKWTIVKITDRLHAANKRVLDLTQAAAKKLGFFHWGLARVKVEVVSKEYATSLIDSQQMAIN
ncbi:rare lipoprotein A [Chitinophaga skermanii]|uniref:Probable endolytic peptidoglycan transglycosylase RlpA n=1 Tax=Chitinophaga skermanii TaxID=331697 RepID=A0A327QDC7_9BACT|nr:septal ring lytic transglycosylase RlpA family protein [Chitinophaga skermanii]RAJ02480.1 rare lipoprotein A [Chitinophaga skermanii]